MMLPPQPNTRPSAAPRPISMKLCSHTRVTSYIIGRGIVASLSSGANDNQCVSDVKKYFGQTLLNTPATNVPFIGDLTAWINWAKNYEYGAACVALKAEQIANSCQQ